MTDHAYALARELGFLPQAEAIAFPWSQRATPRRVLEALNPQLNGLRSGVQSDPKMRSVQLPFEDEGKDWSRY